ncbi:unnamed protein product [Aureobasidium vineae]|uniref:ribonuclease H n=1 Tax=Aureobasidium vineae TaxID=2773715 RepID=A0A9N8JAR6_9PEZI|nr:unnamed protein product [Aureobasidium vineae]
MAFPDSPVELPNELVCEDHGRQICHQCRCDYTFMDEDSEQSSSIEESLVSSEDDLDEILQLAEPATKVLNGAAARFVADIQLTWMTVGPGSAEAEEAWNEECPHHDSLGGDRAEQRKVLVHVDCACPGNGAQSAVGGIGIHFEPSSSFNVSAVIEPYTARPPTSQQAELKAATRALEIIREKCIPARRKLLQSKAYTCPCHINCWAKGFPFQVVIITDSAYLFDCMTSHLLIWRWDPKTHAYSNKKSGKVIINSKYIRNVVVEVEMLAKSGVQVLWKKVPRALNQEADQLAKAGAKMLNVPGVWVHHLTVTS